MGFTQHLATRMEQHFAGEGAEFTKRYEPLKLVAKFPAFNEQHEYAIFKQYVAIHGLVRVGGWNSILAKKFGFKWPYKDKHYEDYIKSRK